MCVKKMPSSPLEYYEAGYAYAIGKEAIHLYDMMRLKKDEKYGII